MERPILAVNWRLSGRFHVSSLLARVGEIGEANPPAVNRSCVLFIDCVVEFCYGSSVGEWKNDRRVDEVAEIKQWPLDRAFKQRVAAYDRVASKSAPNAQVWISESGGAYGSGAANVTDRFVSAFWYLDELAELAMRSVAVHCRQTLVGGHYALLRREKSGRLTPNPDYFATRLWASLMGVRAMRTTLHIKATAHSRSGQGQDRDGNKIVWDARAYAHCRLAVRGGEGFGDLVVLVINSATHRVLRVDPPSRLLLSRREEFHVTAPANENGSPNLDSPIAMLNGRPYALRRCAFLALIGKCRLV